MPELPAFQVPVLHECLDGPCGQQFILDAEHLRSFPVLQNFYDDLFCHQFTLYGAFAVLLVHGPCLHEEEVEPLLHQFTQVEVCPDKGPQLFKRVGDIPQLCLKVGLHRALAEILYEVEQLLLAGEVRVEGTHAETGFPAEVAQAHGVKAPADADGQGGFNDVGQVAHHHLFLLDLEAVFIGMVEVPADTFHGEAVPLPEFFECHIRLPFMLMALRV